MQPHEEALAESPTVPVAVALGSNLGDRRRHLAFGRRLLEGCVEGLRCSRIYETEPRYQTDQPPFLNACCVGRSGLSPRELLGRLKAAERAAGRTSGGRRFGPRTLDLDLLLYGDRILREAGLRVPHPRLAERAFVLVPLAEIAAEWMHPEVGRSVGDLAAEASREGVQALAEGWERWRECSRVEPAGFHGTGAGRRERGRRGRGEDDAESG